jgi:hypothetical protein
VRRTLDVAQVPTGAPADPPDSPGRRLVTAWTKGPRDLAALAALIDGALSGPVATLERTLDRLMEADTLHDCGCDGEAACPLCLAYEDVQEALAVHQARGA